MHIAESPPAPAVAETPSPLRLPQWLEPVRRYGEYVLGTATALAILALLWAAFAYAPTEATQGDVQRIEYIHVPMAWVAYLAFFVVFAASILYLWRRDPRWDLLAATSAEIGTIFTTLVLVTGSLWGRPVWGTWWQWDARMTTTLILWFVYVAYLLLRSYTGLSEGGARAAAVLGIVGFIDVPINYLSVTWWRTLHPALQVQLGQTPDAPPAVVWTLMLGLLAFTLLYAFLMLQVYRLNTLQRAAQLLRARAELESAD
jgi:heme exporter protein C